MTAVARTGDFCRGVHPVVHVDDAKSTWNCLKILKTP